MKVLVEICAPSVERAREAEATGAGRIELCTDLECGGLTPPHPDIISLVQGVDALKIPVNVLIRPRAGDFVYNSAEIEQMMDDISFCGAAGVNGVVIGALNPRGGVDRPLCRNMVALARSYGLSVTFHRAIDESRNIDKALDAVIALGVDRILTSGGAESAWEGRDVIKRMVQRINALYPEGSGPKILAGAGVNFANAAPLVAVTGVSEIHGSRLELCRCTLKDF